MDINYVLAKIKSLKNAPFGKCSIPSLYNELPYKLILLSRDMEDDKHIIKSLAKWRKESAEAFSETFPISFEGTKRWYMQNLIEEPERLLFLVEIDGKYIGHVGLFRFDFDDNSCEVDNIIRGEKGFPGIMQQAIYDMMCWGTRELDLCGYTLQAASDNPKAVNLYNKLHFIETKREPMIRTVKEDGFIKWIDAPEGASDIKRYNLHMRLEDDKIFS